MKTKKKAWHVYIVKCNDGSLYTGITNGLAHRVAAHNAGTGAKYTRSRRPVVLVWSRRMPTESAARKREYRIKKLARAEKEKLTRSSS